LAALAKGRRALCATALLCLIALAASGCDTTTAKNRRAQIAADRVLATRVAAKVKVPDKRFPVEQVQAVGRGKNAVVVVRFHNNAGKVVTDLPISVGVKQGGSEKLINAKPNLYYFQTHVAAADKDADTVWILQLNKRIPKGKLFAKIGAPSLPLSPNAKWPEMSLVLTGVKKGTASGTIKNSSGHQQYVVELYATALRDGKYVAAGRSRVTRILPGNKHTFAIPLEGRVGGSQVKLSYGPGIVAN
jgi:Tfp pilus assembly protein PilX